MSTTITVAKRRRARRRANVTTEVITTQPRPNPGRTRNRQRRLRKRVAQKMQSQLPPSIHVRECTLEYMKALTNPFGVRSTMPCIPDNIVMPSHKIQTKCRGVFSTGTNGLGCVLFDPFKMAYNDGSLAGTFSTAPIMYTSTVNNDAGNVNWNITGGAFVAPGHAIANSNSMFSSGDFDSISPERQLRLVAAGLKIQYTGSNFRNQGRVVMARTQGNDSFAPVYSMTSLLEDNYSSLVPVSRKAEYTFYTPDDHNLLDYNLLETYIAASGGHDHFAYTILVDGGDTETPQSWTFEAVAYFEIIGKALTLSPSHSDVENMGLALSTLPTKNPTVPPKIVEQSSVMKLFKLISESVVQYGPALAKAGVRYLAGPSLASLPMPNATIEEVD